MSSEIAISILIFGRKSIVYSAPLYNSVWPFCLPKIKIEIAISDDMVEQVKSAIIKSSASGKIGDGKIFISPIDEVIRIRTGEKNEDAL